MVVGNTLKGVGVGMGNTVEGVGVGIAVDDTVFEKLHTIV